MADAIRKLSSSRGFAAKAVAISDQSRLRAAVPHRVYIADATDVARGSGLPSARFVGWRFLILDGTTAVATISLSGEESGENLRFAQINVGPFVVAIHAAVASAERLEQVVQGSYEPRALLIPSIYVQALWLKDLEGTNDIVILLNPSHPEVVNALSAGEAMHSMLGGGTAPAHSGPQSIDSFFSALRPVAARSLAFDNTPRIEMADSGEGGPPPSPPAAGSPLGGGGISASSQLQINRQDFIKNYAALVARTWSDPSFLQLLLSNTVDTLTQHGLPTIPGAIVRVLQIRSTSRGKIDEVLDRWISGIKTGLYDLWLPLKPESLEMPPTGGSGNLNCCCTPCCCCTEDFPGWRL
jgi:hypothetical protein